MPHASTASKRYQNEVETPRNVVTDVSTVLPQSSLKASE